MLAGSYILAFQSAYLPDGIVDSIISLRGCALISQMIKDSHMEGIFSLEPELHGLGYELKLERFPALDQDLAHDALRSLAGFAHFFCGGREFERALFAQLVELVRPLLDPSRHSSPQISTTLDPADARSEETASSSENSSFSTSSPIVRPLFPGELLASSDNMLSDNAKDVFNIPPNHKVEPHRSFNALISSITMFCTWPHNDVLHLFSPANRLGAVLIAHCIAVRFIISPLYIPDSAMRTPMKAMIEWGEKVVDSIEDDEQVEWMQYVAWPLRILRTMRCCLNQKKGLTIGDLHDILIKDPGAFRAYLGTLAGY